MRNPLPPHKFTVQVNPSQSVLVDPPSTVTQIDWHSSFVIQDVVQFGGEDASFRAGKVCVAQSSFSKKEIRGWLHSKMIIPL